MNQIVIKAEDLFAAPSQLGLGEPLGICIGGILAIVLIQGVCWFYRVLNRAEGFDLPVALKRKNEEGIEKAKRKNDEESPVYMTLGDDGELIEIISDEEGA